jgi:hypothetical protein
MPSLGPQLLKTYLSADNLGALHVSKFQELQEIQRVIEANRRKQAKSVSSTRVAKDAEDHSGAAGWRQLEGGQQLSLRCDSISRGGSLHEKWGVPLASASPWHQLWNLS